MADKKHTASLDDITADMPTFNPQKDLVNPRYDKDGVLYDICNQSEWGAYFLNDIKLNKDGHLLDGYFHWHGEEKVEVFPKDVGHDKYAILKCPECGDVLGMDYEK